MNIHDIVRRFGGVHRTARALNLPREEVESWVMAGQLPREFLLPVLLVGARRQFNWTWRDFYKSKPKRNRTLLAACKQAQLTAEDVARAFEWDPREVEGEARAARLPLRRGRSPQEKASEARHARILALHAQHWTPSEIAAQEGIQPAMVTDHLRRADLTPHLIRKATRDKIASIKALAEAGKNLTQIAEALGVSPAYVYRLKSIGGLTLPDGRPWTPNRSRRLSPEADTHARCDT